MKVGLWGEEEERRNGGGGIGKLGMEVWCVRGMRGEREYDRGNRKLEYGVWVLMGKEMCV